MLRQYALRIRSGFGMVQAFLLIAETGKAMHTRCG
jgi:hypothetical protein